MAKEVNRGICLGRTFFVKKVNFFIYLIKKLVLGCIFIYQYTISPFLPYSCKFSTSCSNYTKLAITKYGLIKGVWLGVQRIVKCQSFY